MGIEGIGEAVTGGMVARALEPAHGEAGAQDETHCLNCGAELTGSYCHRCGQKGHVHRTLAGFWHELVHGVFHFEGKIWRTLPMLAWRPGELTRRYVEGERARFVSPIALFLFSVFLMFAVFSLIGGPFNVAAPQASAEQLRSFDRQQAELERRGAGLERQKQRLAARGERTVVVDTQIAEIRRAREALSVGRRLVAAPAPKAASEEREAIDLGDLTVDTGWPWLDHAATKAARNPSLLLYKLQTNAYKFSWALIPISVPFLWLLFLHRRRYRAYAAYDHMVFVTYSIAFMGLLLIALSLIRPIVGDGLAPYALTFIPPIHIYRQLRGAYQLSLWSALWRTFALVMFAFIAASIFFVLLLALGVVG